MEEAAAEEVEEEADRDAEEDAEAAAAAPQLHALTVALALLQTATAAVVVPPLLHRRLQLPSVRVARPRTRRRHPSLEGGSGSACDLLHRGQAA